MANLNKINYVDQDFSTASAQIRAFLSTNYPQEFNDYVASNIGVAILDIVAYAEQNLFWNLNRRITDLYFPTAITPRAISKIARMLGYKAKASTSAKAAVSLSFPSAPYTFPVTIAKGFQWQGPANTTWEYRGDIPLVLQAGQTSITAVELSQGETTVANFVSNGRARQAYELLSVPAGKFVALGSVIVKVDGELWTEFPIIPFTNENNFETNLLAFPPVVRFGDGVQGNIPIEGAGIEISFTITDGFRGRIVSQSIGDPVVGLVAQFEDIPVKVNQPNASVGGDDPEDIRSITVNAPKFQRVQDRAITKDDYDFLSNQFENVSKADAQIVRGIEDDATILFLTASIKNAVHAAVDGLDLTDYFETLEESSDSLIASTQSFMTGMATAVTPSVTAGKAEIALISSSSLTAIAAAVTDITTSEGLITSAVSDIDTETLQGTDDLQTIFDVKNVSIESFLTAINSAAAGTTAAAAVTAQVLNVRNKITEMKLAITGRASLLSSNVSTQTTAIKSSLTAISARTALIAPQVTTAALSHVTAANAALDGIPTLVASFGSTYYTGVETYVQAIQDAASDASAAIVTGTAGLETSVNNDVDDLMVHLDEHLTDSCNANEVQVKVLGKDSARKYVAPLQSTLDGLKAYLDARKDIVHTVSVVAGTADVVNVDIEIVAKVSENAVEDDVIAAIKDSLDKSDVQPFGILVERTFNKSLYLWEIDGAIRSKVTPQQIDYLNVKITGPVEYLDAAGNLVIPVGKVVQAGDITVTALARFAT